MKLLYVLLFLLLALGPNAFAGEETPHQAVQSIINLYEAKDFSTLIRERYTEIYKAEAAGKVDELIKKYTQRLSSETKLQQVISQYLKLLEVEAKITTNPIPRETESDSMALFSLEADTYKLYLQKTGKWGFHM